MARTAQLDETEDSGFQPVRVWHHGKDVVYVDARGADSFTDRASCPEVRFMFGTYTATTPEELERVTTLAKANISFEDLTRPLVCPTCKKSTLSSKWFEWHVGLH